MYQVSHGRILRADLLSNEILSPAVLAHSFGLDGDAGSSFITPPARIHHRILRLLLHGNCDPYSDFGDLCRRSAYLDIHPWAPSAGHQATVPARPIHSRVALGKRERPRVEVPLDGLQGVGKEIRCVDIADHSPAWRVSCCAACAKSQATYYTFAPITSTSSC